MPFLVPADMMAALDKLCDRETRAQNRVDDTNRYLLPSTHQSPDHIYGWYAVNCVAQCVGVNDVKLITAIKMCHCVSTIKAALDMVYNMVDLNITMYTLLSVC